MGIALMAIFTLPLISCSDNEDDFIEEYTEVYSKDNVVGSWKLTNYDIDFASGETYEGAYTGDSISYYTFNSDGTYEAKLYLPNKLFDKSIGNYEVKEMSFNYCAYNNGMLIKSRWQDDMAAAFLMYDDYKAMHWVYADSDLLVQAVYRKADVTPTISINPKWLYGCWKCTTFYEYDSNENSMVESGNPEGYIYFYANGEFKSLNSDASIFDGTWKIDNETIVLTFTNVDGATVQATLYLTTIGPSISYFITATDASLKKAYKYIVTTDIPDELK